MTERAALTPLEDKLLTRLRDGGGHPVGKVELARSVWGTDKPGERTVEMAITRLRRKLEGGDVVIATVRGVGYRLVEARPPTELAGDPLEPGVRQPITGGWIDLEKRVVHVHGETITLSERESAILEILAARPGRPLPRAELIDEAFGEGGSGAALRSALYRIRNKIEDNPAVPVHLVDVRNLGVAFLPTGLTSAERRDNLPVSTNAFVPRPAVEQALAEALAEVGVVALVGPGGSGKTRLVERAARTVADTERPSGGVWLCDLSSTDSIAGLVEAVAAVLPARGALPAGGDPVDAMAERVRRAGDVTLVLDNWERLPGTADEVLCRVAEAAPRARLVVTSRRELDSVPHRRVGLRGMTVAEARDLITTRLTELGASERARPPADPVLSGVDGLPLALEAMAARIARSPDGAARIGTVSLRPVDPSSARHSSMQAVLDWSLELLPAATVGVFEELSVIEAPFTSAEAERFAGARVHGALQELVRHHLMRHRLPSQWGGAAQHAGYALFRPLVLRRIRGTRREEEILARHQAWALDYAEDLIARLDAADGAQAAETLARLRPDLRAVAMRTRRKDPRGAARAELALAQLFDLTGPPDHRDAAASRGLRRAQETDDAALIGRALTTSLRFDATLNLAQRKEYAARGRGFALRAGDLATASTCARIAGHYEAEGSLAGRLAADALKLAREAEAPPLIVRALIELHHLARMRGADGVAELEEAFETASDAGLEVLRAFVCSRLAFALGSTGRPDVAMTWLEKARTGATLPAVLQDRMLYLRGHLLAQLGDLGGAELFIRRAAESRTIEDTVDDETSRMWFDLAWVLIERGELTDARRAIDKGSACASLKRPHAMMTRVALELVAGRPRAACWWLRRVLDYDGPPVSPFERAFIAMYATVAYAGAGEAETAVGWHAELEAAAPTLEMAAIPSMQTLTAAWSTWGTESFPAARDSALAFVASDRHGAITQDTRIVARLLREAHAEA